MINLNNRRHSYLRKVCPHTLIGLLYILAIFPWIDFAVRFSLPSFIGSIWDDLFLIVILFYLWLEKRHQNRLTAIPATVTRPFFAFLFFSIASIVINIVPLAVSFDVLRVVYQPMFFILITMYLLDERKLLDRFIRIMIISTVIIAIAGIIQYIFQIESFRFQSKEGQFRIVAIFGNPNALAQYLNMILSFTVAFFLLVKSKKEKLFYLLVSIPMFLALLLTFSRGAWIAFFFMIVYTVWVWNKKWLLSLPILAALTPFVMPESIINRFAKLLDPEYYQMSSEFGRIAFWTEGLIKIKENPVFGLGMGMFGDSVPLRHNIPFSTWVDNHYIKIGAEIGIFGLIAFILLLYFLFRLAANFYQRLDDIKDKAYMLGLSGVIITMAVQNVTASIWEALANAIYFYAFIGILFAYAWKLKNER